MDPQLRASCAQTCYVASPTAVDEFGRMTYSAPTALTARVENTAAVMVMGLSGEEAQSSVLLITATAISQEDRIWLPGVDQTDATLARRPYSVTPYPDEDGTIHHYEVRL